MKIIVTGSAGSIKELMEGSKDIEWVQTMDISSFTRHMDADAFFNLQNDAAGNEYPDLPAPVFINSVTTCLRHLKNRNLIRFNGWKGFIKRDIWEISGEIDDKARIVLDTLGKKALPVSDEPGFISARILAMIINEAWFARGEGVSTDKEIDIAMKLGTNYPKGPFEWLDEIGMNEVYTLLNTLKDSDNRYTPAPLFKKVAG